MTNDDNDKLEEDQLQQQQLIDEWLSKGNKITICEPNAVTDNIEYTFGIKKKKN